VARFPGVMASTRPEVVLLLEGYNDLNLFGASGISRGISALDTMAREARNRGARVFMASLTPPRPGGRNSIDPTLIIEFNRRLRTLASGESAVFVDLYNALLPSVTTYIGTDGLHPTEAGYRRMAEEFFVAIRATLEAP
jgi:lysophospholipase L1-like esterase